MTQRRSFLRQLRSFAESALTGLFLGLARWLPRRALLALGAATGELGYRLARKHTGVALRNLELAFGGALAPAERRRITRACWHHYGRITADAAAFHRLRPDDIGTLVRYEGLDALRAAHGEGKGVLLISGHF